MFYFARELLLSSRLQAASVGTLMIYHPLFSGVLENNFFLLSLGATKISIPERYCFCQ
jgi:hypothetical protein